MKISKCWFNSHSYEVYKEIPILNNTGGQIGIIIVSRCAKCGNIKQNKIYNIE